MRFFFLFVMYVLAIAGGGGFLMKLHEPPAAELCVAIGSGPALSAGMVSGVQ